MDNTAIWSDTVKQHMENVVTILQAMLNNNLYLNSKKSDLFMQEICILGHCISAHGIEPDDKKTNHIMNWPTPTCMKHVQAFIGLVQYLSPFLPNLTNYTSMLDKLTTKECNKAFPTWTDRHKAMFREIKALIVSADYLMMIDPSLMPKHKIFVTTNASNIGSGAVLTFSPTYETAHPIAYNSHTFKGAKLNYPVHEKELLVIVHALAKWHTDLLSHTFEVWTDHWSLEHFGTQHNLSHQQAHWMEFMSQYDATIHYLPGAQNSVADALSQLPDSAICTITSIFAAMNN